ncbi:hypothetical protein CAPTEDRAFT_116613, partial [Capitella teleta]
FSNEESPSQVLHRLLFYSFLIIVFPISSYFLSKSFIFEAFLGMTSSNSYFYAAIVAICSVHIVLGLFIFIAFTEDQKRNVQKID